MFEAMQVVIYDFILLFWQDCVNRQHFPPQLQLSQQVMLSIQT